MCNNDGAQKCTTYNGAQKCTMTLKHRYSGLNHTRHKLDIETRYRNKLNVLSMQFKKRCDFQNWNELQDYRIRTAKCMTIALR